MDGDFGILWILVIAFVVMSMARGGKLSRQQRRMQSKLAEMQAATAAPPTPALPGPTRAEVERLEHRVRVLERIVTDGGYSLASQIEALRDPRPIPPHRETFQIEEKI